MAARMRQRVSVILENLVALKAAEPRAAGEPCDNSPKRNPAEKHKDWKIAF
jgi:hypothetical protein